MANRKFNKFGISTKLENFNKMGIYEERFNRMLQSVVLAGYLPP